MVPRYMKDILLFVTILILIIYIIYHHTEEHHTDHHGGVTIPTHLPRRECKYRTPTTNLTITSPPGWLSCPGATSNTSIWSMATTNKYALYSLVLGLSVLDTWDSTCDPPDLRIIIIQPSKLDKRWIKALGKAGWGICTFPRLDYLEHPTQRFKVN